MTDSSSPNEPSTDATGTPQGPSRGDEYLMIAKGQPTHPTRPMITITREHARLLDELNALLDPSWGEAALLGCLRRLELGGVTEAAEVKVHAGWALDDEFCLSYTSPWGPRVGVRVHRDGSRFQAAYTDDPSPEEFGIDIADFTVAEPLGTHADCLTLDSQGLGWWGDLPLPPARPGE